MTPQLSTSEPQAKGGVDHRLLLDRVHRAGFDDQGRDFVARVFAGGVFWETCTDAEILGLAVVAQQHGLFDQALETLAWLNHERPQCGEGWRARAELLATLGRHPEAVQVAAQAQRFLPAEMVAEWAGPIRDSGPEPAGEADSDRFLEPFARLRRDEEDLRAYLALFRGRDEAFARQWADRDEGKQGYVPVQRPLQAEDLREHLQGRKTYGIYLLTEDSRVWTGVIDVDLVPTLRDGRAAAGEKANIRRESVFLYTRLNELAAAAGLTCIAEVSGGKGYHFWFPVDRPVEAAAMRAGLKVLLGTLAADLRCFSLEVFPKQDRLTGKGYGNLVKLPLGVHRVTGRKSRLVGPRGQSDEDQLAWLRTLRPAPADKLLALAEQERQAKVVTHPRLAEWAGKYPELAELESKCPVLGQVIAVARAGRSLSVREEKVLLGTIGHLERGRLLLHGLLARQPEYNRPLLDFRLSRVRGSVLGCKRIHQLLDQPGELPCVFTGSGYPHPLRHLPEAAETAAPQEKVQSLKDALLVLKTAIVLVERFL